MEHTSHVIELALSHFKCIGSHSLSRRLASQFHSFSPEQGQFFGSLGFSANIDNHNDPKEPLVYGDARFHFFRYKKPAVFCI
jgi:hypothetical protein